MYTPFGDTSGTVGTLEITSTATSGGIVNATLYLYDGVSGTTPSMMTVSGPVAGTPGQDWIPTSQTGGTYDYILHGGGTGGFSFGPNGSTAMVISGLSGVTNATINGVTTTFNGQPVGHLSTDGQTFPDATPSNCGLTVASFTSTSVTLKIIAPASANTCLINEESGISTSPYFGTLEITSTVTSPGPANVSFNSYSGTTFLGTSNETFTGPVAATLTVPIIVNPGEGQPPTINAKNNGKIAVAILSSVSWSAPANVNQHSLTFGETGNEKSFVNCDAPSDVNGDGYLDLVCNFNTQQTNLKAGDTTANLHGMTTGGIPLQGSATVRVIH
jgi:hypothetical protein